MTTALTIRDEMPEDEASITKVTIAAFETLQISSHTEQFIVQALRSAGVLSISLVAERDSHTVGHIAFSPVTISDGTTDWYGLGPVSVHPDYQRQGIGKALIETGLAQLKRLNAQGCCLVGHPAYYRKFGFKTTTELSVSGVPPEVFFVLHLQDAKPRGVVQFHEAFSATS